MADMKRLFFLFLYEMLATFFFVGMGCAGIVGKSPDTDYFAIGIHFGLAGMIILHTFGFLSGALINPSIVIASFVNGSLSLTKALLYLVAEIAGATAAYMGLNALLGSGNVADADLCMPQANAELEDAYIVAIEFLTTLIFIFGLFALLDARNKSDVMPLRYGTLLIVCLLFSLGKTGLGMNSAIMIAGSIAKQDFDKLPLYCAGQYAAAILGPFIWRYGFAA